jgi:hypothetical protein
MWGTRPPTERAAGHRGGSLRQAAAGAVPITGGFTDQGLPRWQQHLRQLEANDWFAVALSAATVTIAAMSWATIVVGFAGALLGGLLGTFATISHERGAEIRTRQLNAAEAFLTAAGRVTNALRLPEEMTRDGMIEGYARESEALLVHIPLVQLVFGRESEAARCARDAWGNYAVIADLLAASVKPAGLDHVGRIREHHNKALRLLDDFGDAASAEVRKSPLRRRRQQLPEPRETT